LLLYQFIALPEINYQKGSSVLSRTDDIIHFEYKKKNNRTEGPALVGIVVQSPDDINTLIERMNQRKIKFEYLNDQSDIFHYIL